MWAILATLATCVVQARRLHAQRGNTRVCHVRTCDVMTCDVILCHDVHQHTVEAVSLIVEGLTKADYEFLTLSQMLSFPDDKPH